MTLALAIGAAAAVLAACGGDEGEGNGNATATDGAAGAGVVSVANVDGTDVLVDPEGRSLYTAEVEKDGIRCTGACISVWEPIGASAQEAKSASSDLNLELGVVRRPDGASQLALDGLPLYTFTEEGPGQLEGNGFVDDFEGTRFEWMAATSGGSESPDSNAPSTDSPY